MSSLIVKELLLPEDRDLGELAELLSEDIVKLEGTLAEDFGHHELSACFSEASITRGPNRRWPNRKEYSCVVAVGEGELLKALTNYPDPFTWSFETGLLRDLSAFDLTGNKRWSLDSDLGVVTVFTCPS